MHRFFRLALVVLALPLSLAACGTEGASVDATSADTSLGLDADSNVLRIAVGARHEVVGTVSRGQGMITPRWSEPVDAMTSRDPSIVAVERVGEERFVIEGLRVGETVLRLTAEGDDERFVPIKVLPEAPREDSM